MPLKISQADAAGVSVLNKWADQQDSKSNSLTAQVQSLKTALSAVQTTVSTPAPATSVSDVTGSRVFGTTYQNTSGGDMYVSGWGVTTGSSTGSITATIGPSSPTMDVWGNEFTSTVASAKAGFAFKVPADYFYVLNAAGAVTSLGKWVEYT